MKNYRVAYAGLSESSETICAASAEEAARIFFAGRMAQNTIIVSWGFWREAIFPFEAMEKFVPELGRAEVPLVVKKIEKGKKLPLWKEWLLRFFFGNRYFNDGEN